MPIISKHKRGAKPSVTRSKKQGGKKKSTTKRRGGKKKSTTKRKGGNKNTRKRKGGMDSDERQREVRQILGNILPDTAARNIAHYDRIIPDHNFKETDSTTPRWRRADDIRAYHQNPRNNGYVFTGEEVVKHYADGYRDDRKRPDGLEMTKSGEEREWYRALEPHERPRLSGAAANYPEEREGPFTANEIANSVFKNTKNKTLSEKMPPGDDRIDKPHYREYATLVGRRKTEERRYKGGGKTRKGRGGDDDGGDKPRPRPRWMPPAGVGPVWVPPENDGGENSGWAWRMPPGGQGNIDHGDGGGGDKGGGRKKTRKRRGGMDDGGDQPLRPPAQGQRRERQEDGGDNADGGHGGDRGNDVGAGAAGGADDHGGDRGAGDQGGGRKKTRKRRGGNPDDKKKTYEQKLLRDYKNEVADHNKTRDDSYAPKPPETRPSWASPTASGWAVAPYNRTQVFVEPEPPIDPSAGPAAGPATRPATRPAAGDNENYRTNPFDGAIRAPPLTPRQRAAFEQTQREIEAERRAERRAQKEEEEEEEDSKRRGLYGRRW